MSRMLDRIAEALIGAVRRSRGYVEMRRELGDELRKHAVAAAGSPAPASEPPKDGQAIYQRFAPDGHYYSPIPNHAELARDQARIFARTQRELPGVTIDPQRFRDVLRRFAPFFSEFPYTETRDPALRFYLDNTTYSRGDAVVLYSTIRLHRPRRIVEIGSGLSTWLMIDVNERFFDGKIGIASIDPHPERMLEGLRDGDRERLDIVPSRVQEVDTGRFAQLREGDVLFVDSTHVSRCDSDVNHIFFRILPALAPGVLVHFHDLFWPFEYPQQWLLEIGAAWNEAYQMRAFLQYNERFSVEFFSDYATHFLHEEVSRTIPVFLRGPGSSLWLRRDRA